MWEKVLKMLWADRITLSKVAAELCVPERELNDLVFGLTGGEKMRVSGDRSLRSI
jgi:hypothetical protein